MGVAVEAKRAAARGGRVTGSDEKKPAKLRRSSVAGAPVLVEVTRGPLVESRHRGRAVVADSTGRVVAALGDLAADGPVYPRSANKALIAIPLVETGAAAAFGLGPEELALACASHSGEPMHTERVARWLARVGCAETDLECGAHAPTDGATAERLARAGVTAGALYNNCSGKHAGMLTTARHLGEPTRCYVGHEHPVQRRIAATLGEMAGIDLAQAPWGVDGCAIPTIGIPLAALARSMARIAVPDRLPPGRQAAVRALAEAWGRHPELVGGTHAFDTRLMQAVGSRLLVKSGAEGMCCAVLPEHGLGVALKVEDGGQRAAGVALLALLAELRLLPSEVPADLARPAVLNRTLVEVGQVRPAAGLSESLTDHPAF